jgi:hypothetical protein
MLLRNTLRTLDLKSGERAVRNFFDGRKIRISGTNWASPAWKDGHDIQFSATSRVWRGKAWRVLARGALHHGSRGDRVRVGSGFRQRWLQQWWLRPDHLAVLVAPLTGNGDVTGIAWCDGEQFAVSDVNAAGGSPRDP